MVINRTMSCKRLARLEVRVPAGTDQLTKVRQALVTIAASRKQIELQEQQLRHSVDHLTDQAKAALSLGKEDLAREALNRKAAAQAQIDGMEPQHQQLTGPGRPAGRTGFPVPLLLPFLPAIRTTVGVGGARTIRQPSRA